MRYDFHDRFTNKVIHTENIPDDCSRPVRIALEQAVIRGRPAVELRQFRSMVANKARHASEIEAKLMGHLITVIDGELTNPSASANLESANLASANLASANLESANLESANLESANLESAYLARANLESANLARANLESAYLARANLESANLASAYLASAYLESAYLERAINLPAGFVAVDPPEPYELVAAASLAEHARRYREHHPEVPVVDGLDAKILTSVTTGGGKLRMSDWHTCDTTHCRGGWAIHHAGKAGYELEREVGVERAAAMIYMASTGRVPWFHATDEQALSDIERWANAGQETAGE